MKRFNFSKIRINKKSCHRIIRLVLIPVAIFCVLSVPYLIGRSIILDKREYRFGRLSNALSPDYQYPLLGNTKIKYNGKMYEYNKDISTFLILGIDKEDEVSPNPDLVSGGQSDVILVAVFNRKTKDLNLINIDRNTIVDVEMPGIGADGGDLISSSQICVQHGFGDGMNLSCELTKKRVSEVLFDVPIDGYLSVNYGIIPMVTCYAGGIEVTIPEGMNPEYMDWQAGDTIVLCHYEDTVTYLRYRDLDEFGSARERSERHKDFIKKLSEQLKAAIIEKPALIFELLKITDDYTVTDLNFFKLYYMIPSLINADIGIDNIFYPPGQTVPDGEFEEFYPDEEELKKLVIDLFFTEISE